jgi:hypothetical protein
MYYIYLWQWGENLFWVVGTCKYLQVPASTWLTQIWGEYLCMCGYLTCRSKSSVVVVSYAHSSGVRGPADGFGVFAVLFRLFVSS